MNVDLIYKIINFFSIFCSFLLLIWCGPNVFKLKRVHELFQINKPGQNVKLGSIS